MNNFKFRYYCFLLTQKLCTINPITPIVLFVLIVLGIMFSERYYYVPVGITAAVFIYIAYQFISPLVYVIKNGRLAEILDKYGYSEEYAEAYEKAKILNKPFDLTESAQFAQIYVEMGQSEKAVEYLGSITLPKALKRFEMVEYLRIYILALLKTDELEKAEDLWKKNGYYINRMKTIPNYSPNVDFIFLTEIYIECCAAYKGDSSRLERAYEMTAEYLKRYDSGEFKGRARLNSFDIILLYELKALGRTEEFDKLYPEVSERVGLPYYVLNFRKIGKSVTIFDNLAKLEWDEFEKAANGVLPFLDHNK